MEILFFLLPVALIWGLYKLIHMRNPVGAMFRLSWNIVMEVCSFIPGLGWCSHFIVSDDKQYKEEMIRTGEAADLEYQNRCEQEKWAREEQIEAEKLEQAEAEADLRQKIWKEEGRTDVQFNSDSSRWKYSDESSYDRKNKFR